MTIERLSVTIRCDADGCTMRQTLHLNSHEHAQLCRGKLDIDNYAVMMADNNGWEVLADGRTFCMPCVERNRIMPDIATNHGVIPRGPK